MIFPTDSEAGSISSPVLAASTGNPPAGLVRRRQRTSAAVGGPASPPQTARSGAGGLSGGRSGVGGTGGHPISRKNDSAWTPRIQLFLSPFSQSRTCPRCGEDRAVEEFARDKSKSNGRKSFCKSCDNAKSKRYYAANRERVLARIKGATR